MAGPSAADLGIPLTATVPGVTTIPDALTNAGTRILTSALTNALTGSGSGAGPTAGSGLGAYGAGAGGYGLSPIPIITPYHSALQGVFGAAGGGMVPDAKNLSDQGRNGDSMLVHMTPREVAGLQALAQAHGTSLTTNPTTGLPEASILSDLLPSLIGGGLSVATDMSPWMSAALVGGGYGLATGNLKRGLMAGLGAYGGAGLGSALERTGRAALERDAMNLDASQYPRAPGESIDVGGPGASGVDAAGNSIRAFEAPSRTGAETTSKLDRVLAGLKTLDSEQGWKDLKASAGDKNALMKYGLAAMAPAAMGYMDSHSAAQGAMPAFSRYPQGRMPIYRFNMNPYTTPVNGRYFNPTLGYTGQYYADGGAVAYGAGGASDVQVDPYSGAEVFAAGGMPQEQAEVQGLLKGPGDGVSDSIPAQLDTGEPARLATGEFVVPARIVSELGNGDTDAGAKKLYAMMDRIQAIRSRTTGDNVALDSKADQALPA